ncbi:MAG: amino acid permease, partial [Chthoniobacterales bacterium]
LILAGARVSYAMARDGFFFRSAARLNRHRAPAMALLAQGLWAAFLTLPRTVITDRASGAVSYGNVYTQLLEYIVSADLIFYVLMVGAVMVLRRKLSQAERPYRTWGYPVVPLLYITIAGLLIADLTFLAPFTAGVGILLVLTGVPVFLIWRKRGVPEN